MAEEEGRTTWDGKPVSSDPPFGATIIVRCPSDSGDLYLLLHRANASNDEHWAWTPPSGVRLPSEPVVECAKRELGEETGLWMEPFPTRFGTDDWPVSMVEIDPESKIVLSAEHDRFE
jgi:8-oxo-dGTP pyrophosphatase MutT (NUDIX family)